MVTLRKKNKPLEGAAPERALPSPLQLEASLTEALMKRRTAYDFSDEPVSDEHLASILWAADGLNGKNKKDDHRTTPTALNWKEIDIYVVKANGVWLWDPVRGVLSFVHDKDRRKDLCLLQPLVRQAPVHLVYVYDEQKTQGFMTDLAKSIVKYTKSERIATLSDEVMQRAPLLDAGAKVMAVYLACAALGINCMARQTFESAKVRKALLLKDSQTPLCVQTLGYKPRGLLDLAF